MSKMKTYHEQVMDRVAREAERSVQLEDENQRLRQKIRLLEERIEILQQAEEVAGQFPRRYEN